MLGLDSFNLGTEGGELFVKVFLYFLGLELRLFVARGDESLLCKL